MRLSASRRGRAGGQGEARPIRLTPEGRANPAPFRPLGETDDLGAMQSAGRGIEPRPAQSLLSVCRGILAWVRASFQGSAVPPICCANRLPHRPLPRSEEHPSELQSLMRISYAVFCLKKKKIRTHSTNIPSQQYI